MPPAAFVHAHPALWQAMFEQSPTPMMLVAASGHVVAVNHAWQQLFGVSDAAVSGNVLNYNLLADPALIDLHLHERLAAALQGTAPQDDMLHYDPSMHGRAGGIKHIHVYLTPLGYAAAYTGQLLITLLDTTSRIAADTQRQTNERRLRAVVDHSPALIFLKDLEHRFILANRAMTLLFGVPFEGRFDYELFPAAEVTALHAWDEQVMAAGRAQTFEETLDSPEGPRRFLTVKFPLRDDDNAVVGVGGIAQDITERMRAEDENARLLVSEKAAREADKVKSEFLATMSHEIRTPLAGIIGLGRIVMDKTTDAEARKHLKNLDTAAHMLLHILNDVLDLSKLEAKKIVFDARSFDLYSLVDSTCQTLAAYASSRGLRLAWNVATTLPRYVVGDSGRIAQVLNNLVNNAIKFSEHGTITIDLDVQGAESAPEQGPFCLQVSVTDQGIGIRQEDVDRLFKPFSQADGSISRRFGGTGLGLTICRAIVQGLGGEIHVTTALGQGSTFVFTIPVKVASYQSDEATGSQTTPSALLRGRVLVVEDNPVNQTIAMHQLAKLGLQADLAIDGAAAVTELGRQCYDIILMDCHMPVMDGFEATKHIRAMESIERSTIPIIALTANALAGERERCLAAGMTDYLTKPVNLHDLQRCLARFLHTKT